MLPWVAVITQISLLRCFLHHIPLFPRRKIRCWCMNCWVIFCEYSFSNQRLTCLFKKSYFLFIENIIHLPFTINIQQDFKYSHVVYTSLINFSVNCGSISQTSRWWLHLIFLARSLLRLYIISHWHYCHWIIILEVH